MVGAIDFLEDRKLVEVTLGAIDNRDMLGGGGIAKLCLKDGLRNRLTPGVMRIVALWVL